MCSSGMKNIEENKPEQNNNTTWTVENFCNSLEVRPLEFSSEDTNNLIAVMPKTKIVVNIKKKNVIAKLILIIANPINGNSRTRG